VPAAWLKLRQARSETLESNVPPTRKKKMVAMNYRNVLGKLGFSYVWLLLAAGVGLAQGARAETSGTNGIHHPLASSPFVVAGNYYSQEGSYTGRTSTPGPTWGTSGSTPKQKVPLPDNSRPIDTPKKVPSQKLVPMKLDGGTYAAPVTINSVVTLDFIVDSGAAYVSIPADVVLTLVRTGTLQESDFIGQETFEMADGSQVPSATFRIRSLQVGDIMLENVVGSVTNAKGSLLLGQSFLGRFQSWSIDNAAHALVLSLGNP